MAVSLADVVAALGGELQGVDAASAARLFIGRLASLEGAASGELAFLSHPKYAAQLGSTNASCVIVSPAMAAAAVARQASRGVASSACIVAPNPYLYFARLTQWWRAQQPGQPGPGIHPSAVVDPEANVTPSAHIGPLCVIERGAVIGAGTVLKSRVTVGADCRVGERCILHAGVVIGADGFGFAPTSEQTWEKIEQLGAVVIGNDVEIGANTCVDRGALEDTVIEDGVKLDNLVQIGHNVRVGAHSALAGCVGVAGSARIGKRCQIGGGAIVLGHLSLGDDVHVSAATVITRTIQQPGLYSGVFPADDNASWEKNAATLRQLHRLRERIKALEKQLPAATNGSGAAST